MTRDSLDAAEHDASREPRALLSTRGNSAFASPRAEREGSEPPRSYSRGRAAHSPSGLPSGPNDSGVVARSAVMAPEDSDVPSSATMTMEAWAELHGEGAPGAHDECSRMRLIGELTRLLHEAEMPPPVRMAGLTVIGWLARRQAGEVAHALGAPRCPGAGFEPRPPAQRPPERAAGPVSERSRGKR